MATKKQQAAQATREQAAQKQQQALARLGTWNAQRPTGYESQYKPLIDQALGAMQSRSFGSSYTHGTDPNYRQYAKQYTAGAQAAAENAAANTAALSGGYGSSYADSAAAQAYQDQMTGLDNILPALRAQALGAYDSDTNSLQSLLAGLQQQEQQAFGEYTGSMSDWTAMRDYLAGNLSMADTEAGYARQDQAYADQDAANLWNNILSAVKWALGTGIDIYDTYKGYKQQDLENQLMQQQLEDQWLGLYNQYMTAGNTQEAARYAERLGLNMEDWVSPSSSGMSLDEILSAQAGYQQALSLGDRQSAALLAEVLGYDPNQMSLAPAAYAGYKASSGATGSGTAGTAQALYGSGLSYSDYMKAASQLAALNEDSPNYSYLAQMYKGLLESPAGGYATGSGYTPTTADVNRAREIKHYGGTSQDIAVGLNKLGYSTEQIMAIMNAM